jgi:hypothetical protein
MAWIEKIGGRKFLLTVLAFGTATAVELCSDRGITEAYALLIASLVGVYGATNVAITKGALASQAATDAVDTVAATADTEIQLAQLASSQDEIKATVDAIAQNVAMTSQILAQAAGQQAPRK